MCCWRRRLRLTIYRKSNSSRRAAETPREPRVLPRSPEFAGELSAPGGRALPFACVYMDMLEPSADEILDWGNSVTQFIIEYLSGLRDRPVYRYTSSREVRSGLDSKLPIKGTDFDSLLKVFRDKIVPFSRQNAHPRMFGYVQSPGTPIGAFADLLASTLNANLTIWRSAPAPVELERVTIDWVRQILGFRAEAGGLFVSGGSMANLAALAAARQTKYDSLGRLRLYASSATHFSIAKAATLLGIGRENVQSRGGRRTLKNAGGRSCCKNHCRSEGRLRSILRRWECWNRGYRRD